MNAKLGYSLNDRLVIINADDLGMSHSANKAIFEMFDTKSITSSSIMMTCRGTEEAVVLCKSNAYADVGIHLTLTCSEHYRYPPLFQPYSLDSLILEDRCFPKDPFYIEKNAKPDEVRIELKAQIEAAYSAGINPTHLDSHDGSLMGLATGRDFLEIAFDLCEEYQLPFLFPHQIVKQPFFSKIQKNLFAKRIHTAITRGILLIDDLISLPYPMELDETYASLKFDLITKIKAIKPGTTQITLHPARHSEELKSITDHYEKREIEFKLFNDPEISQLLKEENIKLISWKVIRDLQRTML